MGFSLDLFKLYNETIAELEALSGFIAGGHNLINMRLVDDTDLQADTERN